MKKNVIVSLIIIIFVSIIYSAFDYNTMTEILKSGDSVRIKAYMDSGLTAEEKWMVASNSMYYPDTIAQVMPYINMEVYGAKLFSSAINSYKTQSIMQMLEFGMPPDFVESSMNRTPIMAVCGMADLDCARILIGKGVDLNRKDKGDRSVVDYAVQSGELNFIKYIIAKGAKVKESHVLLSAIDSNKAADKTAIIKELIRDGANLNDVLEPQGITLIAYSASVSRDLFNLLHNAGADVKKAGMNEVIVAAISGDIKLLKKIVNKKMELNHKGPFGKTAVNWAAKYGDKAAVSILVKAGADINITDDSGNTPLFYAYVSGDNDTVELLLKNGAKKDILNKQGLIPSDMGKQNMFSIEITKKVDPLDYFPLKPGNKWKYESTLRELAPGDHKKLPYGEVDEDYLLLTKIKEEKTVLDHVLLSEGKLVRIKVHQDINCEFGKKVGVEMKKDIVQYENSLKDERYEYYLIVGNYIYEVDEKAYNPVTKTLSEDFIRYFNSADLTPEFVFPINVGLSWTNRDREEKDVESIKARERGEEPEWEYTGMFRRIAENRVNNVETPAGKFDDCWNITLRYNPSFTRTIFKDGVGIIKKTYSHHGTYQEMETVLTEWTPVNKQY